MENGGSRASARPGTGDTGPPTLPRRRHAYVHADPLGRVEDQHATQQVQCVRRRVGKELAERLRERESEDRRWALRSSVSPRRRAQIASGCS